MEPLLKWPYSDMDCDWATLITLESKLDVLRLISYEGKNQHKLDDFLLQCHNTFVMKLNMYDTDRHQVQWVVSYLWGQVTCTQEYHAHKPGHILFTWESFQKFLQNELKLTNLQYCNMYWKLDTAWQMRNQSVTDFFNYLDEMLSHVNQFTNEQVMEWALSGLHLEIWMVIEQMPTQLTSYAELGAITHQIEQSQRGV